jgi:hypothetical protein
VDLSRAVESWHKEGFAVLPALLAGPELDAAVADLNQVFPCAEEYHAKPLSRRNQRYTGDEFGGIIAFPFPSVALCNLVVCDALIGLAQAILGTEEVRIYAAELWAKYTGAASYKQRHHRDYLNHTPLAPSDDPRWRGLEMFIWLCDVAEDLGATHLVPFSASKGLPALPHGYLRRERPDLYKSEVTGAGPAGTVVAYSTETFHRGTELTTPRSARFSAHVSYRRADVPWLSRHAWGDRSFTPEWNPFVEQASIRQLLLFGFPPPGHPYWTGQTLEGMHARYPDLDLTAWRDDSSK